MAVMIAPQPLVLSLQGDGELLRRLQVHERFLALYDAPHIVIDLSNLTAVDGLFLAELAQMRTHRRAGGHLVGRLVVASERVREALEGIGFAKHWPIFETLDEALASFDGPPIYA